jgi:TPP-dependent pyruvate/acetoin dehydrogenase alpha subunit
VHDAAFYVPKEMFEQWAAYDPIERYRTWLQNHADLSEGEESEITATVKRLLNDALDRADASPQPDPSTLVAGVFASQEDLDTPHHK